MIVFAKMMMMMMKIVMMMMMMMMMMTIVVMRTLSLSPSIDNESNNNDKNSVNLIGDLRLYMSISMSTLT